MNEKIDKRFFISRVFVVLVLLLVIETMLSREEENEDDGHDLR